MTMIIVVPFRGRGGGDKGLVRLPTLTSNGGTFSSIEREKMSETSCHSNDLVSVRSENGGVNDSGTL